MNKSNSPLFKEALASLATDPGLHPLVPYFTYFVADEVDIGQFKSSNVTFVGEINDVMIFCFMSGCTEFE